MNQWNTVLLHRNAILDNRSYNIDGKLIIIHPILLNQLNFSIVYSKNFEQTKSKGINSINGDMKKKYFVHYICPLKEEKKIKYAYKSHHFPFNQLISH